MTPAEEIREKKATLADAIHNLISEFEKDTGTKVARVGIGHVGVCGDAQTWDLSEIDLEVRI